MRGVEYLLYPFPRTSQRKIKKKSEKESLPSFFVLLRSQDHIILGAQQNNLKLYVTTLSKTFYSVTVMVFRHKSRRIRRNRGAYSEQLFPIKSGHKIKKTKLKVVDIIKKFVGL